METDVSGGADEEGLEEVLLRQLVDVARDVDVAAGDGDGATEAEQTIQVEGGNLSVVSLVVGEVEMVGKGLLQRKGKEKRISERGSISFFIKFYFCQVLFFGP